MGIVDEANAAAQRAAAEAARKAAEEAARRAAEAAKAAADRAREAAAQALRAKATQKKDELSTGKGGALRRTAALMIPSAAAAAHAGPVPTPSAPAFRVNAFGAPMKLDSAPKATAPPSGKPAAFFDPLLFSLPAHVLKAKEDTKSIDAAVASGGFQAGKAQLQKLLAANPDPTYQATFTGLSDLTLAKAAVAEPAKAASNTHDLLAAAPDASKATLLNAVLLQVKDPAAQKAIIAGSQDQLTSAFKDPDAYDHFIGTFSTPEIQATVAQATAPQAIAQVQALAATDPVKAADTLKQLVDAAPASARADLVKAAQPAITALTKTIDQRAQDARTSGQYPADNAGATAVLESLSEVAKATGPDGAKLVTDAMAPSIGKNAFDADSFGSPAVWNRATSEVMAKDRDAGLGFFSSLRDSLKANGRGADAYQVDQIVQPQAISALRDARGDYDDAKGKVDELDKDLGAELANLGPSLSDADKQKYIAQFRKDHQDDYKKLDDSEAKLGDVLKIAGPGLLDSHDPNVAQIAFDSADALSKTPAGAEGALDFVELVGNHPDSLLYSALGGVAGNVDDALIQIRDNCIPNIYAKDLGKTADPEQAGEMLKQQLEGLENNKKLAASIDSIRKGVQALTTGDLDELSKITSTGGLQRAFQGAGVVLGIYKLGKDPSDLGATEYLKTLAATGAEGSDVLSAGFNTLNRVLNSPGLESSAAFLENVAPGLRAAASALGSVEAFQQFLHGGNAGDVVNAIGGLISTVGALGEAGLILDSTGVGLPVGIAVQVVGTLVSLIGSAISSNITDERRRDEEKDVLKASGFPDPVAEGLSSADKDGLKELGDLGLKPEQIQAVAGAHPDLVGDEHAVRSLVEMTNALKLSPADVPGLLDAAGPKFVASLHTSYEALHLMGGPTTQLQITNQYLSILQGDSGAQQYVKDHAPGNFSADGKTQRDADAAYDDAWRGGNPWEVLALKLNDQKDPVFDAEIVKRMKDQNLLGSGVDIMIREGYADPAALRSSLQSAHDAGVISDDELSAELKKLGG